MTAAIVGAPRVAIIIPARFASQRYPGKPLAMIRGGSGQPKPLIRRSWETARSVSNIVAVLVATDDDRIREAAEAFGAKVVMTSPACRNGTERCAEALSALPGDIDIIVNIQGDAPLTPVDAIPALVSRLMKDPTLAMATPAVRCSPSLYRHLIDDQMAGRVGGTTVVFSSKGRALYFSKRVIPHLPPEYAVDSVLPVWLHLGVYAYRPTALAAYSAAPPAEIEQLEGLEQLRFLDAGIAVSVVEIARPAWDVIELNNPSDLAPIEAMFQARGID
jgi:3-deoxy-manno-octulosonate cytidylyltransferase (CMP-KDO synthetase)